MEKMISQKTLKRLDVQGFDRVGDRDHPGVRVWPDRSWIRPGIRPDGSRTAGRHY